MKRNSNDISALKRIVSRFNHEYIAFKRIYHMCQMDCQSLKGHDSVFGDMLDILERIDLIRVSLNEKPAMKRKRT